MHQYVRVIVAAVLLTANPIEAQDHARQEAHARNVTITRDTWGIPHIHGKSDADAVFGMIYAQAEDDFSRVEMNYVRSLGRLAELEGADAIYEDLRQRLYFHPDTLRAVDGAQLHRGQHRGRHRERDLAGGAGSVLRPSG